MKPTLLLAITLPFLAVPRVKAQTTIFSENVGSPSGTTAITSYTGWQNNGTIAFSGTGDVRTTTGSSGYTGASGSGNVFLTTGGSASFIISGIDTSAYQAGTLDLTFGAYKSNTASTMSELSLAYSTDGTNYTSMSIPAQASGTGTAIWRSITLTATSIPIASNVYLKWTNTAASGTQFRLDDISLSGTSAIPEPSAYASIIGTIALACMIWNRRKRSRQRERDFASIDQKLVQ